MSKTNSPARHVPKVEEQVSSAPEKAPSTNGTRNTLSMKSSETNSETTYNASVSGSTTNIQDSDKLISFCLKGDWIVVEQILRNIKRGHSSLSVAEEASI
ncbi:hypothetical protein ACJMK2_040596 [Sinanodonta woodiana]|uniref:Uncharacterized protein n=1 Tax=Sinanodonta woodiana TaxID=1069815 RepID=A0ABD3W4Q1_SINWO